jgi:hypothetical protein
MVGVIRNCGNPGTRSRPTFRISVSDPVLVVAASELPMEAGRKKIRRTARSIVAGVDDELIVEADLDRRRQSVVVGPVIN